MLKRERGAMLFQVPIMMIIMVMGGCGAYLISYLILVTGTTGGARGEKFCHVEKFVHMTNCQVEKFSTGQIVMWKKFSTYDKC